jgi:hypothetical protein
VCDKKRRRCLFAFALGFIGVLMHTVTQERKANSIIIPEADADDDTRELHNDVAIFSQLHKPSIC